MMSEARNNFGRKSITPKTKKLHPRVDLTAMINVSYLLIVFFMLTSYLSKPQVMELGLPDCGNFEPLGCYTSTDYREMTLLLGDNDKIISYVGQFNSPMDGPKVLSYNKNSLRKELIHRSSIVKMYGENPRTGLIVRIKLSTKSSYENIVNVLDEMAIVKVATYTIADITAREEELLATK